MLNLKSWLSCERGRATALASHLGVSLSRISQMTDNGVPKKHMLSVRDFTCGEVSLESMVQGHCSNSQTTTQPSPAATAPKATHG